MRPRTPLAARIAQHTGVPEAHVQYTFENLTPGQGPCWPWGGMVQGITPMIGWERRAQPVRRVLTAHIHGELPADVRVRAACPNPLCVSPNHTLVKARFADQATFLTPPPPEKCDQDDINDVVDAVYSRDRPWDAAALAEEFDYPRALVEAAIRKIEEEGL